MGIKSEASPSTLRRSKIDSRHFTLTPSSRAISASAASSSARVSYTECAPRSTAFNTVHCSVTSAAGMIDRRTFPYAAAAAAAYGCHILFCASQHSRRFLRLPGMGSCSSVLPPPFRSREHRVAPSSTDPGFCPLL